MFTGIIEELGKIKKIEKGKDKYTLYVKASKVLDDTKIGDSIAVNGICLTVTELFDDGFTADVMPETLDRSSLSDAKPGDILNLERAMEAGKRFGGHIVSGHVDGVGVISDIKKDKNAVRVSIKAPENILKLIVEKGSIAIDGISLTVTFVDNECFGVSLIPHTGENTTLLKKKQGMTVNLENDVIAKYVEKIAGIKLPENGENPGTGINMEFLIKTGMI